MGISRKIVLLQVVLIVSFIGVILAMGHQVWGRNYIKLEQEAIRGNVARTYYAWEVEQNILMSLVADWCPWDDLYAFAANPEEGKFVEENLSYAAMANLKIDMAIVTSPSGKIVFAKAIDVASKTEKTVPIDVLGEVSNLVNTGRLESAQDQQLRGFIVLDRQPILISMQKILTSQKQGPSSGVLIFAKYGDAELFQEISKITQVNTYFENKSSTQAFTSTGDFYQEIIDDEIIKAYYPLQDVYGNEGYFLASSTPRDIYKQGQTQMKSFLILTITFGFLFIVLTVFVLNRMIFSRVGRMGVFMQSITEHKDYSIRLDLAGKDELSQATAIMNNMLAEIELSQQEIKDLYEAVQNELDERKKIEESLRYVSFHDPLTGLYNRTYFEQEVAKMGEGQVNGVGVVCCDLDGLKLINDTLGHSAGDRMLKVAATILKETFDQYGVVARIGGDEFAILLLNISEEAIQELCQQVRNKLELDVFGDIGVRVNLSLGWGYSAGTDVNQFIVQELVKQADDSMYRQKLSSSYSNRNTLVQGMLELLKVRDFMTEGHSQRLQEHVTSLGRLVGLKDTQITDLCLLAQFHDIGKVGVSDAILFKTGSLSFEERREIQRHSEIGQRIAISIPELVPISDFILKHHEWWNGEGYPLGLKGIEISIENRILAIADAYDAMTSNRPYRQAMSIEEALAELHRSAGIQFDPDLVERFIQIVRKH